MEKEKKVHYVDNKQFFAEMEKWKTKIEESTEVDDLPPMVTEYMLSLIHISEPTRPY